MTDTPTQESTTKPISYKLKESQDNSLNESLVSIKEMFSSLEKSMSLLQKDFNTKIKYDKSKDTTIDSLHRELQTYREDLAFKFLRPLVLEFTRLSDQMRSLAAKYKEPSQSPEASNFAEDLDNFIREKKDISFMHDMQRARVSLTREKFDELTEHLLDTTIEKIKLAIAEAEKKGVTQFDKILMVGGSTRMPQVSRRIQEEFGQEPQFCDPDEAVAKGAAVYGHHLMLGEELVKVIAQKQGVAKEEVDTSNVDANTLKEAQEEVAEIFALPSDLVEKATTTKIVNVTSRSFGVISLNQKKDKIVRNLILKNDSVPASKIGNFGTAEDNQENVLIEIVDNFSSDQVYEVEGSRKLGEATLTIPSGLPAGAPIEITYEINEQGLLQMYAKELTEGLNVQVTIEIEDGISQKELEEAKERSKDLVMV
ncbi:MAG: Hsp70 family protein [Xenococcaceae cyanobacterium MO_207.B15]|nr:Hsp70 family protein [Xenococcaceae cyanobacterium MO_207.B15]